LVLVKQPHGVADFMHDVAFVLGLALPLAVTNRAENLLSAALTPDKGVASGLVTSKKQVVSLICSVHQTGRRLFVPLGNGQLHDLSLFARKAFAVYDVRHGLRAPSLIRN
jgi:hypothetical protein